MGDVQLCRTCREMDTIQRCRYQTQQESEDGYVETKSENSEVEANVM